MIKIYTLCFIHRRPRVLLGLKKRGFGKDLYNGFGGKVLENESLEAAAKREVKEEAGILVDEFKQLGVLDFEFIDQDDIFRVHIFKANNFKGEPKETEEMKPQWFGEAEIPFEQMWPGDIYWLPLFLANKNFKGRVLFDESDGKTKMVKHELTELTEI